jgi:signal transduction histidine kinase
VTLSLALAWRRGDPELPVVIGICSTAVAAVLLGLTVHMRRTYAEERARHLREGLDQRGRIAAAAERARIAREVHDIVAHNLAVMVALADGASATATTDPARAAELMSQASATGREALSEMRRLVGLLRLETPDLSPQPGSTTSTGWSSRCVPPGCGSR